MACIDPSCEWGYRGGMADTDSVAMLIAGVALDPVTRSPIVVLRDEDGKLHLPIWIGLLEATAIASQLEGVKPTRPMTHDLLLDAIAALGAGVQSIEVSRLDEGTFFAEIQILRGNEILTLDARPSDAIGLALRAGCPIRVARSVLDAAAPVSDENASEEERDLSSISREKWREILEKMSPDDFKYKM